MKRISRCWFVNIWFCYLILPLTFVTRNERRLLICFNAHYTGFQSSVFTLYLGKISFKYAYTYIKYTKLYKTVIEKKYWNLNFLEPIGSFIRDSDIKCILFVTYEIMNIEIREYFDESILGDTFYSQTVRYARLIILYFAKLRPHSQNLHNSALSNKDRWQFFCDSRSFQSRAVTFHWMSMLIQKTKHVTLIFSNWR